MPVPASHLADAQGISSDGYPKLFEIGLRAGGFIRIWDGPEITWDGKTWESSGVQLSGISKSSSDDINRPTLTLQNPDGAFSTLVDQGFLNHATVTRYMVKLEHLMAGVVAFQRHRWRIATVTGLNRVHITCELRSSLDGQHFVVPTDMYIPPEYPMVSLT